MDSGHSLGPLDFLAPAEVRPIRPRTRDLLNKEILSIAPPLEVRTTQIIEYYLSIHLPSANREKPKPHPSNTTNIVLRKIRSREDSMKGLRLSDEYMIQVAATSIHK
jgi:hypothetical protein